MSSKKLPYDKNMYTKRWNELKEARSRISDEERSFLLSDRLNLIRECEKAKMNFSASNKPDFTYGSWDISVNHLIEGVTLKQSDFTEVLYQIIDKAMPLVDETLQSVNPPLMEKQINVVFMAGGTSLIPLTQEKIKEKFGEERVIVSTDTKTCVALGAAFYAWAKTKSDIYEFSEVAHKTEHRLGILQLDEFGSLKFFEIFAGGTLYGSTSEQFTMQIPDSGRYTVTFAENSGIDDYWFDDSGQKNTKIRSIGERRFNGDPGAEFKVVYHLDKDGHFGAIVEHDGQKRQIGVSIPQGEESLSEDDDIGF
jgi:hypothetical protein